MNKISIKIIILVILLATAIFTCNLIYFANEDESVIAEPNDTVSATDEISEGIRVYLDLGNGTPQPQLLGSELLTSDDVEQLIRMLEDDKYKDVWSIIVPAIGIKGISKIHANALVDYVSRPVSKTNALNTKQFEEIHYSKMLALRKIGWMKYDAAQLLSRYSNFEEAENLIDRWDFTEVLSVLGGTKENIIAEVAGSSLIGLAYLGGDIAGLKVEEFYLAHEKRIRSNSTFKDRLLRFDTWSTIDNRDFTYYERTLRAMSIVDALESLGKAYVISVINSPEDEIIYDKFSKQYDFLFNGFAVQRW